MLEHVRHPDALLTELVSFASTRGRVIASIPNFAHWYPRIRTSIGRFDYDQRGILDNDHVRFFTRQSFLSMCQRTGWEVIRRGTTGVPFESMGSGSGIRAAATVDRWARAVWPTMFAYQFVYELEPLRR